jgi:hypothetical protein
MLITGRFAFPSSEDIDTAADVSKDGDTEMGDLEKDKWRAGVMVSAEEMTVLEAETARGDALRVDAGKALVKGLDLSENDLSRDALHYQVPSRCFPAAHRKYPLDACRDACANQNDMPHFHCNVTAWLCLQISNAIRVNPRGPPRQPPPDVIERYRRAATGASMAALTHA